MPGADHKFPPTLGAKKRELLAALAQPEVSLADVLHAIHALTDKIDRVETALAHRASSLTLDPAEIARTMMQLRSSARPVTGAADR
ncbi:hypothetical protein [Duganella callida]|uniref:Uncharacterized protein n=1 Tax=Duganella callida TaxID=2561932 RepID=A0A4Y9S790_9BURK|nr:hypothetical protein [Duganella callida]TFW15907.1 hypothetical protein E4L98_24725 [Duganella callida]